MIGASWFGTSGGESGQHNIMRYPNTYFETKKKLSGQDYLEKHGYQPSHPVAILTSDLMFSANSLAGSGVEGFSLVRRATPLVVSTRASSTETACRSSACVIRMV